MRKTFANRLAAIGALDPKLHLITGDVGGAMFDDFRTACPGRHVEYGIAEQSMVGFAAGMAMAGLHPVVYTITPFLIERAFEQVKLDIDAQNVPVWLVGYSGYPTYGVSHNELDAVYLMRLFNNVQSEFPETLEQLDDALANRMDFQKPWFLHLHKVVA